MFTNILVPLDGSHLAEAALPAANYLAQKMNASITLIHVIEKNAPDVIHGEHHLSDPEEANQYLRTIALKAFSPELQIRQHVHTSEVNDLARSIVNHSDEFTPDLIILCSHGNGGFRDFLMGSIAQQVINMGKTPVLLIHPHHDENPAPFQCNSILVPLDGMPDHEAGLPIITALANVTHSSLHLLFVVPTVGKLKAEQAAAGMVLPSAMSFLLELTEENAKEYLSGHIIEMNTAGIQVTSEVLRGDPADLINKTADRINAGLILLSTHGKVGQNAFWAGSIAAKISNTSRIPILLVHSPEKSRLI